MTAIDMSILKIYSKRHPTSFFFFFTSKYKTCHCEMLRVLSKDCVYQSQIFSQSLLTIH